MEEKKKSAVFHFASYTEKDRSEQVDRKGWVNYGVKNDYPQYLNDMYMGSPTHHALVDSIALMVTGDGISSTDTDTRLQIAKLGFNEVLLPCAVDLKLHGGYYLEVIASKGGGIAEINHVPFEKMRVGEKDEGKIKNFWYSNDWLDPRKKDNKPISLPYFYVNDGSIPVRSIICVKPFSVGSDYYPKPDYVGALNYIELEKEISTFHVNNIKNGLFPSAVVVHKNGIPSHQEKALMMRDLENDLRGAENAGKFVNFFADDSDSAPEIIPFNSNDADNQYSFLSEECTNKIMVGHRVVTPALFGVKTAGQLGQQGELEVGEEIFMRTRVKPMRKQLLKGFETILEALGLFSPITLEEIKPQTTLSVQIDHLQEFIDQGEELGEEWELLDSKRVDGIPIDCEKDLFASVPSSNPNGKSEQDTSLFKVRYAYAPNKVSENTREFCKRMIKAGKVYRFEDIDAASDRPVNPGFGPEGSDTYNLWLYKGGARCHHFWERRIYMKKNNKKISVSEARRIISSLPVDERDEARIQPNDRRVAQRPTDMPNNGYKNPR